MYLRENTTEEFLDDLHVISHLTVSQIITVLAPTVKSALEEFVPAAKEAIEPVQGRAVLVEGTIPLLVVCRASRVVEP
jgi:hypothetical protein